MEIKVDLWHARVDSFDAATRERCARLMSKDETARHARFVFEKNRHEYLATRGLARGVLATYVARPPESLAFVHTDHGRPLLEDSGDLVFNLTNTTELVACAVARGRRVGVDTEPLDRAEQIFSVADTVFTKGERDGLARLALPERRRRAVELWTVKEAYIKARSLGMSLPVEKVEIVFPGEDPASTERRWLRYYDPVVDPTRWELTTFEIEGHLVSTCTELHDAPAEDLEVDVRPARFGDLF